MPSEVVLVFQTIINLLKSQGRVANGFTPYNFLDLRMLPGNGCWVGSLFERYAFGLGSFG